MNHSFSRADALVLVLISWIILSVWLGYTIGLSPLAAAVGLAAGAWAIQQNGVRRSSSPFPDASLALVGLFSFVLLGILVMQGGFDRSGDTAPSFAAELIQGKIPQTYQPFFDLPFFYPPGLPSIVSQFEWTGIPTHGWSWIFGSLGLILIVFYSSRLARILEIPHGKFLIPALIIGLRFPLQSLLSGEYAVLLGFGIGLASIWLGRERKEWFAAGIVASAFLHPYAAIAAFLFGLIVLKWKGAELLAVLLAGAIGTLPMLWHQVLPVLAQSSSETVISSISLASIAATFSLIGLVPTGAAAVGAGWILLKRPAALFSDWRPWGLLAIGAAGVLFSFFSPSFVFGGKIILLLGIGFVFIAAKFFPFEKNPFSEKHSSIIILLLILFINATSPTMVKLADGSKITLDEANYAVWLSDHFPVRETNVLFLSKGHGKMAQYAHTIPFDALSSHFLTSVTYTVFSNTETDRIRERARQFKEIFSQKCISCAEAVPADWIVVNTREFPRLNLPVAAEENGFILYSKKNNYSEK